MVNQKNILVIISLPLTHVKSVELDEVKCVKNEENTVELIRFCCSRCNAGQRTSALCVDSL